MSHGMAGCRKQFTQGGDRRQGGQVLREVLGLSRGDNTLLLSTCVVIPSGDDQADRSDNIAGSSASYSG